MTDYEERMNKEGKFIEANLANQKISELKRTRDLKMIKAAENRQIEEKNVLETLKKNKSVLIIEKRDHIGGNVFTENINGINVHKYGAHIFHTSNEEDWNYVNDLVPFNNFINSPIAFYKDKYYHLPFNMYTFQDIWGIIDLVKAKMYYTSKK